MVKLLAAEEPSFVVFSHQEVRRNGVPDISVDGNGVASRWEFKHATPYFQNRGIQLITCKRLAEANHCMYVIYYEQADGSGAKTLIVHPRDMPPMGPRVSATGMFHDHQAVGHDHRFVVRMIRKAHGR